MRKVCVVITARPSYSRIRSALEALKARDDIELQVVAAASALLDRYGSVVDEIERDGFEIASKVYMVLEGEQPSTMAKTTGIGMIELATALDNLQPDFVVTIADRHETLATAVAAAYMNIPLVHIQGGEITGSIDEKVRHAITKLSDYHLVSTEQARERVVKMGEEPETVIVTGCPSIDIAAGVLDAPDARFRSDAEVRRRRGRGRSIERILGGSAAPGHHRARDGTQARSRNATRGGRLRHPHALVLAQPRCGFGRHVAGHPGVPGKSQSKQPALLQEHGAGGFPAGDLSLELRGRELERGDPGVLVSRGSGGEHRWQAGRARSRVQRARRRLRPRRHRGCDPETDRPRPLSERFLCTGTVPQGPRIADAIARIEPRIHKRLNY